MYRSYNMENLTLNYFDARGRGECVRLLLAAAGVEYKDNRVTDWAPMKPSVIYGQLPMLDANGVQIGQSGTIMRYIASCTGFGGKTPLEQAKLDATYETFVDASQQVFNVFLEKDETLKKEKMEKGVDKISAYYQHFDKQLEKGGPFFGGDSMTYADIQLFAVTELIQGIKPDILSSYPNVTAAFNKVAQNPKVAEYVKNRKQTKF